MTNFEKSFEGFEMLKEAKGVYERKIDIKAASEAFKDFQFV